MTPAIGEIIEGKYRIVRLLGQGGMGAVFEGENLRIRRRVAIKLLHENISSQAESVARFEREAQAAARIGSDHICEVLDLGVLADGTRYMVMEYLEGESLGTRIERVGKMGPEISVPIMVQVLEGLGAAHSAGIIHRDLKPDNIFILPSKAGIANFVKVLDFGVSKFSQLAGDEMSMTRTGAVVGTPYYMSPEQARGASPIDHRTDIYAMGVLLYQATTGQVPFDATTFNELLFKIVLEPAPPPQQFVPDIDPEFAGIIQKAMAREQAQRYQTCAEFKNALLTWLSRRPGLVALPANRPTFHRLSSIPSIPDTSMQTPQQLSGSASQWSNPNDGRVSVQGLTGSGAQQFTANSWGDASGVTGQSPRTPSKAPLIVALAASVTVLGLGAVVWMALSGRSTSSTVTADPAAAASSTTVDAASSATPAAVNPPVPVVPVEPAFVASATGPEAAPPASASAGPSTPPAASSAPRTVTPEQRPTTAPPKPFPPTTKPATPSTSKPNKPPVPSDFGY
jgi:eukaryotic-like serine/threonine-protein kinase